MKIAIIGGGWAGLAAAISAAQQHEITLYEMAPELGGRARSFQLSNNKVIDNGQHILIGAYSQTLKLLETVGIDIKQAFYRAPFWLQYTDGTGITLPGGMGPTRALLHGLWDAKGWSWRDKLSLLWVATEWRLKGFCCAPQTTVKQICKRLTSKIYEELIEPICTGALNTQADVASGKVFLRVIKDAFFSSDGGSTILIPRIPLSELFPQKAEQWLREKNCKIIKNQRVKNLNQTKQKRWLIDNTVYDAVVIATTIKEAIRLIEPINQKLADKLGKIQYESITTTYIESKGTRLTHPMLGLKKSTADIGQFIFDLGAIDHKTINYFALVRSADAGIASEKKEITESKLMELKIDWQQKPQIIKTITEKRATFKCSVTYEKLKIELTEKLYVVGDYVGGEYPSTLESATRSGLEVAERLAAENRFKSQKSVA